MRKSDLSLPRLILLHFCLFFIPIAAWAQTPSPQSRIVDRVNEGALVTLRGNTHPLAQPQFDQGAAPPDLSMARMLLVLKRSDAQESALQKLLDDQQDLNSPSYHQWLTPDAFGRQFGLSNQDMQVVAAWLISHGFQIGGISQGRTVIEFSGTALQVQQAFHTEIHKYAVNGEEHWANASDPQIPAALSPVVEGINTLHNFPKKPMYRFAGKFSKGRNTGGIQALGPEFTINDGSLCGGAGNCYFVGPYDFASIYNVLPLWTAGIDGSGQTIAIVNESNINIQDVRDFRNLFGLDPLVPNDPQIIVNGLDPGLVPGVESEADLDVEWSGAVAKGATIKLVVTAPTNATAGVDLSAVYAVENSVAPIISESFGECELFLGNAGNRFQSAIRQQAAAQGITFINSSGDEGSARCDPFSGNLPDPATHGLMVSGLASSPYGVAVGGTDFLNFGSNYDINSPSPYWGSTNDPQHQASALGYVPETTWNDTCTNNVFIFFKFGANPEASCNNSQLANNAVDTSGGGGGKSSCTTSDGVAPSSCSGGYAKPSWQSAPGVPADGVRDIPDVSLFASPGFMNSAYIICESDQLNPPQSCSLNSTSTFLGIGGTSASAPAFAGIVALVNQSTGSAGQGNANYVLYKMASSSAQTSHACGATSNPSSGCIFYDVTSGTNAVPCAKGSSDCTVSNGSDVYGVLSGYNAGTGYDLATGLGSVNAANLVHNWIQPTNSSTTTLSLNNGNSVSITHGQSVNFNISVTPSAATGLVSLAGTPTGSGSISMASLPLQNGSAGGTTTSLAGGSSYSVKAHYSGNGTYAPSDSSPVTITVNPEPSRTLISVPVFDPRTGIETGNSPASIDYGTPLGVRVDVGNSQATTTFPPQNVCAPLACPTGNVALTDTLNGNTSALSPAGGFALNTGGFAEDDSVSLFSGGMHLLTANYPGDNSFNASSNTYALTVNPGATRIISSNPPLPLFSATPFNVGVILTMNFFGVMPSCNFTFYDGTTTMQGTPNCAWQANGPFLYVTLPVSQSTAGAHTYSAKFNGDTNYAASASAPMTTQVFYGTTTTMSADSANVQYGTSITLTALVDSALSKGPALPNTVTFYYSNNPIPGTVSYTPTTDSSGNFALRASISFAPQFSSFAAALFNGDSNYFQSGSTTLDVNVNIPDFSLSASLPALSITAGNSAAANITITPVSNAPSPVMLLCPSLNLLGQAQPAGVSCSFSPSTVNLSNGTTAASSLTISTLAPSSTTTTSSDPILPPPAVTPSLLRPFPVVSLIALLLFFLLPSRVCRKNAALGAARALCLLLFLGFVGCGAGSAGGDGGGGPTPTSITLTASSVKVPYSSTFGGAVNLTANISSSKPAGGTVTFTVDAATGFSVTSQAVGGAAQFQLTGLPVGIHTLTAQYSGDTNSQSSQTKGGLNIAVTGQTGMTVQATTGGLLHRVGITFNLQ